MEEQPENLTTDSADTLQFRTKGFIEVINAKHHACNQKIRDFIKTCVDIRKKYTAYSRSALDFAKRAFEQNDLPTLKKIANELPELSELTRHTFESYDSFMSDFSPYNPRLIYGTNAQLGYSGYKLHISLSPESYEKHKKAISKILIRAIKEGTIKHYKRTRSEEISTGLKQSKQKLQKLQELNNSTTAYIFDFEHNEGYNVADLKKELEKKIIFDERLLTGDQYTIYIPLDYEQKKIIDLCNNIHKQLAEPNTNPGTFAAAESPLTPFISFRQDTIDEEYVDANDTRLKDIQEKSSTFIQLKKHLEDPSLASIHKLSQQQPFQTLPSQAEINTNSQLFLSDHKPVIANIPLSYTDQLTVLTWNICHPAGRCRFDLSELYRSLPGKEENDQKLTEINQRIQEAGTEEESALKEEFKQYQQNEENIITTYHETRYKAQATLLKESQMDVLLIQEADPQSYAIFKRMLEPEWVAVPMRKGGTTVSFYRTDKYQLIESHTPNDHNDNISDIQTFSLKAIHNEKLPPIHFTNLWGAFHHNDPQKFKERALHIDTLLAKPREDNGINVVGGDLNIPVGVNPNDNSEEYIDAILYKKPQADYTLCQSGNVQYHLPEDKTTIYLPGDAIHKQTILLKIQAQMTRIETSEQNRLKRLFFKKGTDKIAGLTALYEKINNAPQGANYTQLISDWEQEKSLNQPTVTYREILHKHRLGRENHADLTTSEKMIDEIKTLKP